MEQRHMSHQDQIAQWESRVFGQRSMFSRFEKLQEETQEVLSPLSGMRPEEIEDMSPEQRDYFAKECTDVIMIALGIIGGLGHSFDQLYREKLSEIYEKYPPDVAQFLQRRGMSPDQAVAHLKEVWNGRTSS